MVLQQIFNILYEFLVVATTATSFYFIFRPTGFFHLTHGSVIIVSAYSVITICQSGIFLPLALAGGMLIGAAFGCLFLAVYARLGGGPQRDLYVLIASIGLALVVQNCCAALFGDSVRRADLPPEFDTIVTVASGLSLSVAQIAVVGLCVLAISAMLVIWYGSGLGRAARAISENSELALLIGIPVSRRVWQLGIVSAVGASAVGMIAAIDTGVTPSAALDYLLPGIIAAVIGGGFGLRGVILGAFVLAALSSSCSYLIGSKWADLGAALLLAGFLIARPQGVEALATRTDEP